MAQSTYNYILGIEDDKKTTPTPQAQGTPQQTATPATTATATQQTETTAPQAEAQKPTVDGRMAEWTKNNPEPVRREVAAPQLQQTYSYKDILDRYAKAQKPDAKAEKRKRINQSIAAVGDTIGALINAVGTTRGANNMPADASQSLSEKMRQKYKEDEAKAKDLRDRYFALQMQVAGLEDKDNQRSLSLYNTAQAKADSDYNTRKRNWDSAYDRKARSYERQDAAEQKAEDAKKTQEYRDAVLDLKKQGLNETARYHSGSLNIQKQRADNASGKDNTKYRIGEWHSDRTFSKEELATVAARMFEKGLITVADYNAAEAGLKNFAPLIEKAARTATGERIMKSNGFTKNK